MHFRVTYQVEGKTYACEYPTQQEAQRHSNDIEGYGFLCSIEPRTTGVLEQGPFKIEQAPTCWERLGVHD